MASNPPCPFCQLPPHRIIDSNPHGLLIRDAFPVSLGHSLVIARRHIGSFFALNSEERDGMLTLLDLARAQLHDALRPDGFNIGINDGPAAGQNLPHLHMHLIPRYVGDVRDPRGGIRWVLPDKADYWTQKR